MFVGTDTERLELGGGTGSRRLHSTPSLKSAVGVVATSPIPPGGQARPRGAPGPLTSTAVGASVSGRRWSTSGRRSPRGKAAEGAPGGRGGSACSECWRSATSVPAKAADSADGGDGQPDERATAARPARLARLRLCWAAIGAAGASRARDALGSASRHSHCAPRINFGSPLEVGSA